MIMLRYTIGTPFQPAFPQPRSESAHKNPLLSRQCAVNGVTFHRIFRLVDPFVKVHILIIKLDRFSRPFSSPLASVVVSPPHVQRRKYDNIFVELAVKRKNLVLCPV